MSNKSQPLAGKTLLITRQQAKAEPLAQKIRNLGGYPLLLPTIAIVIKRLSQPEKDQVKNISNFDWLVFTSAHGVESFWKNFSEEWQQLDNHNKPAIAAVGQKTKEEAERHLGKIDFTPEKQNGRGLGEELPSPKNSEVLWPCGNLAGTALSNELHKQQAAVYPLVLYETHTQSIERSAFSNTLQQEPDAILFTSPSSIKGFFENLQQHQLSVNDSTFACIGQTTAKALKNYGYIPHVIAREQSIDGLLSDLSEYLKKS